jgi:hypothetical protein
MEKKISKSIKKKKEIDVCTHDVELTDNERKEINSSEDDLDAIINWYEVILFTNEQPRSKNGVCYPKRIVHAVIRFIDENGTYYIYEWGKEKPWDIITDPKLDKNGNPINDLIHTYQKESWFGCKVIVKDVSKKKIPLREVMVHARQWVNKFGKGGSYPNNCRGYVQSAITCLFKDKPIDWKKYD